MVIILYAGQSMVFESEYMIWINTLWYSGGFESRVGKGPKYTAQLEIDPNCGVQRSLIDGVFRELLGKLPARNVRQIETYD